MRGCHENYSMGCKIATYLAAVSAVSSVSATSGAAPGDGASALALRGRQREWRSGAMPSNAEQAMPSDARRRGLQFVTYDVPFSDDVGNLWRSMVIHGRNIIDRRRGSIGATGRRDSI